MQQRPKGAMTSQHESDAIKRSERNAMDSQAWWGRNGISHLSNGDDHGVLGVTTMSLSPPNHHHHHLHGDSSSLAKQSSEILRSDGICGEEEGIQSVPPMELFSHTIAFGSFPYSDPYYGGVLPANYGQHSMCVGLSSARMALPLEVAEEPVYVNAKQYHGILRRRQIRAKAELEKKLVKVRKPYLHKSRHLHAMRRARGSGGRFLNTKEAVEKKSANDSTVNPSRSSPSSSDHHDEMSQNEAFSNANGSSYYARNHEFQLSAYHSLSSGNYGKTENEGDVSGQHRDRIMVRGAHRALSIK